MTQYFQTAKNKNTFFLFHPTPNQNKTTNIIPDPSILLLMHAWYHGTRVPKTKLIARGVQKIEEPKKPLQIN